MQSRRRVSACSVRRSVRCAVVPLLAPAVVMHIPRDRNHVRPTRVYSRVYKHKTLSYDGSAPTDLCFKRRVYRVEDAGAVSQVCCDGLLVTS